MSKSTRVTYEWISRRFSRSLSDFPRGVPKDRGNTNIPRVQFVNALQQNPHQILNSTIKRKTPFKTIIILGVGTIISSLALYVGVQMWHLSGNEDDDRNRDNSVFVPLWLNLNLFYSNRYKFPHDLKYFDNDLYQYTCDEIQTYKQKQCTKGAARTTESDSDQYLKSFQEVNVKYKVLEKIVSNRALRNQILIPVELDDESRADCFQIWIETKYPTVSGLIIHWDKEMGFSINWKVSLLNIRSLIEGALILAGLKLDRLERSEANSKVHERASGKIHEVPINSGHNNRTLILNSKKDFDIWFAGEFVIRGDQEGLVTYRGKVDFDHLMINRGVKIIGLSVDLDAPEGTTRYKVL